MAGPGSFAWRCVVLGAVVVASITGSDAVSAAATTSSPVAHTTGGATRSAPPIRSPHPDRLRITVEPATNLVASQPVTVTVSGLPDQALEVTVCDAAIGRRPTFTEIFELCDRSSQSVPAGPRPYELTHYVRPVFSAPAVNVIDCWEAPDGCVMAVIDVTSGTYAVATTPIEFGVRPLGVRLTAYSVVHPGDPLPVEVSGVRSEPVGVAVCARDVVTSRDVFGGPCGPTVTVPPGTSAVDVDLVAIHHFTASDGSIVDCGPGDPPPCVVAVGTEDGSAFASAPVYYYLDPWLWATPSTGLVDGQEVELASVGVSSPSYDGPPFWIFPTTGRWSVVQCDQQVTADQTILGIFTHCALPPGGPLPVDDPSVPVEVAVQATITRILGGTTDCAAPEAPCVLALARLDSSGTVELHATRPLSFTSG